MKFPTFRKPAAFWFSKNQETALPGIDVPLQTIVPEFPEEMSRIEEHRLCQSEGECLCAVERVRSDRASGESQKTTHDFFPTKPPTPSPVEKERPEASAVVGSGAAPKFIGAAEHVVVQEFAPSFAMVDGRLVTIEDSVKADPGLAVTMLQGLALPKDMGRIPQDL